ncbi:MAG: hypothetical protein NTY53_16425, partial [Kiritimatiellaeota bacterium]|nr:hypothetical protein [Kiritimatiellota bacterium]
DSVAGSGAVWVVRHFWVRRAGFGNTDLPFRQWSEFIIFAKPACFPNVFECFHRFGRLKVSFDGQLLSFDSHRESFHSLRESFGSHRESFGSRYESFHSPDESFDIHQESFHSLCESFGNHRETFDSHCQSFAAERLVKQV